MIQQIPGATRYIGKSQGYKGLPVRDATCNSTVTGPDTPMMETAWQPTPDELVKINAGASIIVQLIGKGHPPIMLEVGPVPE